LEARHYICVVISVGAEDLKHELGELTVVLDAIKDQIDADAN
jgi:hypothetical protein